MAKIIVIKIKIVWVNFWEMIKKNNCPAKKKRKKKIKENGQKDKKKRGKAHMVINCKHTCTCILGLILDKQIV